MPTSSTVGLGKTYATITAFIAAVPAIPLAGYIGLLSNGQEFSTANGETFPVSISKTTSAVNYLTLTTDTGQSFRDDANKLTNPLKYNQAVGVGILNNNYVTNSIINNCDFITLQYLQFKATGGAGSIVSNNSTYSNNVVDSCILEQTNASGSECSHMRNSLHVNCLFVMNNSGGGQVFPSDYTSTRAVNCTCVRPSDKTIGGYVDNVAGSPFIENCLIFGFTGVVNGGGSPTGSNNASNLASIGFGSANVTSLTYANQFFGTTSAAMDFRLKSGNGVATQGVVDTTNIPGSLDILGQARGASWSIGCHQYISAAAAGPFAYPDFQNPRSAMRADFSTQPQGSSETLLLLAGNDALPFRNRDFPNPRAAMQPVQTQRQGFPAPYIPTITQAPFSQTDWPVPRVAARRDDGTQPLGSPETLILLSGQDALPARNRDFPNPRSAPQPVQTPRLGTAAMTLTPGLDALPFRKLDWPNPRGFIPPIQTQPLGLTTLYLSALVAPPFAQTDWPNPRGSRWPDLTQPLGTPDNLLLLAGKDALPFRLTDFPNPRGYGPPIQTQPQGAWRFLTAAAPAPVQPIDWPNPRPAAQPVQTQAQGAWAYITAALAPVFAQMWPNPRPAPAPAQPQAQGVGLILIGPAGIPVRPIDWPNPRAAFRPDFTQPQGGVIKPVGPKPFAQTDWPNPRCPMQPIYTQPLGTAMSGLNPPIPTRCHTVSGDPRVRTVFGEDRIRIVVGGCC